MTIIIIKRVGTPDLALGSGFVVLGIVGIGLAGWTKRRPLDVASLAALASPIARTCLLG
jgi:hypothetical protein